MWQMQFNYAPTIQLSAIRSALSKCQRVGMKRLEAGSSKPEPRQRPDLRFPSLERARTEQAGLMNTTTLGDHQQAPLQVLLLAQQAPKAPLLAQQMPPQTSTS